MIETLLAVGGSLWIALHFASYVHLALSACIAPFLLLRSERSTKTGLAMFRGLCVTCRRGLDSDSIALAILCLVFLYVVCSAGAILCRVAATVAAALRYPLQTLAGVPSNWFELAFCADVTRAPELVPGIHASHDEDLPKIEQTWEHLRRETVGWRFVLAASLLPILLFGWLPAWLYRWSIKSTAIVWLPLLWAVGPVGRGSADLLTRTNEHLSDIREGIAYRISLALSIGTIAAGLGKLVLVAEWNRWQETWTRLAPRLLDALVAPMTVYPWQLAALLNAVIAWALFLWADGVRRRGTSSIESRANILSTTLMVRRLLTLYTTANMLGIVVRVADLASYLRVEWQ